MAKLKVPKRVLLVCTANQCRSAAAECLLSRKLAAQALNIEVHSAGVHAHPGASPLPETIEAMQQMGYNLAGHRSQALTPDLVDQHDLILGMARGHFDAIAQAYPRRSSQLMLFRPYAEVRLRDATNPGLVDDVQDPVGGPLQLHRQCVEELEMLCARLVLQWKAQSERRWFW